VTLRDVIFCKVYAPLCHKGNFTRNGVTYCHFVILPGGHKATEQGQNR
jgi:hypothetical protein